MQNTLLVINTKNKDKITALQQVIIAKSNGFSMKEYVLDNQPDVRPVKRSDAINSAKQQAKELFNQCSNEPWFDSENTATIAIQKGTNLLDLDEDPELFCVVAIYFPKRKIAITQTSEEYVPLGEELRDLVFKNMDLYDAYEKIYGEKIKNKQLSLYEYLTQKSEVDWIAQPICAVLDYLKQH